MERDNLDRWLSNDEVLVPSSGFAAGVMDAVRREASAPPPMAFPWTRALPGMVATALALAATVVSAVLAFNAPPRDLSDGPVGTLLMLIVKVAKSPELVWIAFAAILTVVPVMLSMRLAHGARRS